MEVLDDPDDNSLIRYFLNLGPNIGGTIYNRSLVSWGPHRDDMCELEEAINSYVLRHVVGLFSNSQEVQIDRILERAIPDDSLKLKAHRTSMQLLIDEFGIYTFRSALRAFQNQTLISIQEYTAIVDSEVRQESILESILGVGINSIPPNKSSGGKKKR